MVTPNVDREKKRVKGGTSPLTILSYVLLGVALLSFCLTGVIFEGVVNRLPMSAERLILALTIVLPAVLGTLSAFLAIVQRRHRSIGAFISFGLNAVMAIFFTLVLLIAG